MRAPCAVRRPSSRIAGQAARNASTSSSVRTSGGASRIRSGVGLLMMKPCLERGGDDLGRRRPSARSRPISRPSPRTSVTRGSAASPSRSCWPSTVTCSSRPSASMVSMTASAAAQATGLPPKVVPWLPGCEQRRRPRRAPMQAPIGKPPARPLATVTMSGVDARRSRGRTSARCGRCRSAPRRARAARRARVAISPGGREVALGRHDDAGLALDRLEQHRGGLVGDGRGERVGVAVRHEGDVAGQRLERRRGRPPWRSARARPWCGRGSRPRRRPRGCGRCAGSA